MSRSLLIALVASVCLAGCAETPKSISTATGIETDQGVALLQSVPDVATKKAVARMLCIKAGLKDGSREHARCVSEWHGRDPVLSRFDARQQDLRRRQLCLEPGEFVLVQCLEI